MPEPVRLDLHRAAPTARTIGISIQEAADNIVLFDDELTAYHALDQRAFAIWRMCDGSASPAAIAAELSENGLPLSPDVVALTIAELAEAGLLDAPERDWGARLERRRLVKLAAAGLTGGVLIPAIASITHPDSAAAVSPGVCPAPLGRRLGQSCTYSCQCNSPLCCKLGFCTTNIVPQIPCAPQLP